MGTSDPGAGRTNAHPDPSDQRKIAIYQVAASHYISGNELQWTLLYYYFVASSILALAWSSVFANSPKVPNIAQTVVLSILALAGMVLSGIWLALQRRANSYTPILFQAVKDAEEKVKVDIEGSMARVTEYRRGVSDGISRTRNVLTMIPLCFLMIFAVLFFVALWPHLCGLRG